MKFNRLGAFTLGVVITAVSVGAVSFVNAAGDKQLKACANKNTGVMRYISKGSCKKKTETSLSWNQMGPQGSSGSSGAAGAKGDTGAAGTKGDTGAAGAKGDTGTTGAKGDTGTKGDTGAAGASSPTGFKPRSVCGPDGTTLCAVGVQGPGGGTIVFVDSTNEMIGYDYLEVAPTDASPSIQWSTTTPWCGPLSGVPYLQGTDCQITHVRDATSVFDYWLLGTGEEATRGIIVRLASDYAPYGEYAAGVAYEYSTPTATDWFLPSIFELNEVCKYAATTNQTPGAATECSGGITRSGFTATGYWSSSEYGASTAFYQSFAFGGRTIDTKATTFAVRPVRAF
jgi:hypothetical protein